MKNDSQTILATLVDRLATIVNVTGRTVTDWQTIAQKLEPSRQLIQAHTTVSAGYVAVKLFSRG
jgi:hypothetical protein